MKQEIQQAITQHTPGPWEISTLGSPDYARQFGVYAEGCRNDLAIVCNDNSEANARLIASAPELLGALVELVERAEAEGNLDGLPEYERARAAIAKAKGVI